MTDIIGLRIYNDDNILILDDTDATTPVYIKKYSFTDSDFTADPNYSNLASVTFSYTGGDMAMFVLYAPNGLSFLQEVTQSGNTYTVTLGIYKATGTNLLECYVFDRPPASSDELFKILKADGSVIFNANYRPISITSTSSGLPSGKYGFVAWGGLTTRIDEVPGRGPNGTPTTYNYFDIVAWGAVSNSTGVAPESHQVAYSTSETEVTSGHMILEMDNLPDWQAVAGSAIFCVDLAGLS